MFISISLTKSNFTPKSLIISLLSHYLFTGEWARQTQTKMLPQNGWKKHYHDPIMSAMASQITSLTIIYSTVYSRRRKKKTSNLGITGLCEGNSPLAVEFPAQRASIAENVSIWWRHHDLNICHIILGGWIAWYQNEWICHTLFSLWQYSPLTRWRRDKMAAICADDIFKCISSNENVWILIKNCTEVCC